MCGLFGFSDPKHTLTQKQIRRLTTALATASEQRGTDASGIAYVQGQSLRIYKRPRPAHEMTWLVPLHTTAVCCFSERMRKLFRKNEKNVLRFCNKKAKEKRRLQRVKKPM